VRSTEDLLPAVRVLLVEDSVLDAEMIERALRGLDRPVTTHRVSNEPDLRAALQRFAPHIVLSDYSIPGFSGHEALRIVHQCAPLLPFIFVSDTIGQEAAIEALRGGAVDYESKDNLLRLPSAIDNALRKVAKREQHEHVERALRDSEERFRTIVESTEDWVWERDRQGRLTYSNASVENLLGYPPEQLIGRNLFDLLDPDDRADAESKLRGLADNAIGWRNQRLRWCHRNGSVRLLDSTARPLFDGNGVVMGSRGVDRDVTLRTQQEAKIRQMARIHAVLSALGTAILRSRDTASLLEMACRLAVEQGQFKAAVVGLPTPDGRLVLANRCGDEAIIRMLESMGPADLESDADSARPSVRAFRDGRISVLADYAHSDAPAALRAEMARVGAGAQIALPIGTPPWALLLMFAESKPGFDSDEIALIERIAADLDYARDFIAKSDQLEFLAYKNPVTGLPNHVAFEAELKSRLAVGSTVVGMLNLVQFGQINDTRGRAFGDSLLVAAAERLSGCFAPATFLAHIGGKSFMFAGAWSGSMEECLQEIAHWLRSCSKVPLVIEGEQVVFALRCGITLAPEQGRDLETLERFAMSALADAARRDVALAGYTTELSQRAEREFELERELRVALDQGQFALFLQPKFDAASRSLVGAEALLRWRHSKHGMVSPAEFIPLLEGTGLIVPVGRWVMASALEILRRWRASYPGDYRIAVNVSARELREQGFVESCRELFGGELDHRLDIEVTESLLMVDINRNIQVLNGLRDLGCQIAIDDFGTGYSSLSYLSRLPADQLKIDQSFTSQMASSPDALALVTNIIGLAHSLSLKVVAEGVEDEGQEKLLRLLRCDQLQGYLLGRPIAVDEFERVHLN